ncbi:NAD(P)-binding protein, partial [Mycobacterium tuberculosis]
MVSIADTAANPSPPSPANQPPVRTRAVIIGTGFSGLGMAIALQKQGVDFVILEKADDVGGTWRDHPDPGVALDHPLPPCPLYHLDPA